jgi:hypothetical protein
MPGPRANATHSERLGRAAEDIAIVKLSTLFEECIVSQVANNQLHDLEIRRKDALLIDGICRIQVKSTNSVVDRGGHQAYAVGIHHNSGLGKRTHYREEDADFFIFYVFPEAKFYVVPTDAIEGRTGALLYAGLPTPRGKGVYEGYLEAWELIAEFLGLVNPDDKEAIEQIKVC